MYVVLGTRLSILVVMWYYLAHAMLLLMLLYCDVFYLVDIGQLIYIVVDVLSS
jgi:hypothetical protein